MQRLSMDANGQIMDYGRFSLIENQVWFQSADTGRGILVENMAQGARGFIDAFLEQDVSIVYSEIQDPGEKRKRMLLHGLVRRDAIAMRAYEAFQTDPGPSPDSNWFIAESQLLHIPV